MLDAPKRNVVYDTANTVGRMMCVLGSFLNSRIPKPTRPGINILRCLYITGIPRKKLNEAEVIFCYILDVTPRNFVLFSLYGML